MSFGGHVTDMNNRIRENRMLIKARKERTKKVLDKVRQVHNPVYHADLQKETPKADRTKEVIHQIRNQASIDRKRNQFAFYLIALFLVLIAIIGYYLLIR